MTYLSNSIELFLGTKNDPNFIIQEFSADRCDIEPLERKSVPSWNKGIPDTEENKKSKSEKMKKYRTVYQMLYQKQDYHIIQLEKWQD